MGFFKSSKSHLEEIQQHCTEVTKLSRNVRDTCDRSLRGKYEYMRPEERADLDANDFALGDRHPEACE